MYFSQKNTRFGLLLFILFYFLTAKMFKFVHRSPVIEFKGIELRMLNEIRLSLSFDMIRVECSLEVFPKAFVQTLLQQPTTTTTKIVIDSLFPVYKKNT